MFSKRPTIRGSVAFSQAVSSIPREVVVTVSLQGLTDHDDCETPHTIGKYRISVEVECETSCDFIKSIQKVL